MNEKSLRNRKTTDNPTVPEKPSADQREALAGSEFGRLFDSAPGSSLALRLMELLPAAIYTCNAPSGVITYYNRRAAELWGRSPAIGDTDERFCGSFRLFRANGKPLPHGETPMAQVLNGAAPVRNQEVIIERPNGSRITVLVNIDPITNAAGETTGAINVFADVSDLKQAEQASRQLAAIVESSEDAIISKDLNGIITSWNQAAERIFGYTADEVIGQPITVLIPPERYDEEPGILDNIKRGQRIEHYETVRRHKNGSLLDISLMVSPIRDAMGNIVGASKIAHDITQRKQAEVALRESEERLAAELQAMKSLHYLTTKLLGARDIPTALNEVLDAAIAMNRADFGNVQVFNPASAALEIVAQRGFNQDFLNFFRTVSMDDQSACARAMKQGKQVSIEDVENDSDYAPYREIAAKAGYRAVQSTPLLGRGGDLIGILSTHFRHPRQLTDRDQRMLYLYARQAADLIERLRSEEELRQSEERLRHQAQELEQQLIMSGRLVSLGEVTASMAHEFNNPLGIIMGFVEDMLSGMDPSDPNYRALQIIDEESKRCRQIVRDLMEYARPRNTEFCSTSITDAIEKTLQLVANRLYKQNVAVEKKLKSNLPRIQADPQQLEQVLVNLYLNAIDAMPQGGQLIVEAEIVQSDDTAPRAVIAVTDTGFGIVETDLPKIFQPFFTAKKRRGMGLGLPICRRIINNHGGRIAVESNPGSGSTFKIHLPFEQRTRTESQEPASTPETLSPR
ncbi:MAG TPA: PAS domain S-box protein [Candidatus Binatia bacterium]|nr:PAS domain S-box protein [Candidatus Binatia bacterium]